MVSLARNRTVPHRVTCTTVRLDDRPEGVTLVTCDVRYHPPKEVPHLYSGAPV